MDTKEIINIFMECVLSHPVYYFTMFILLIVLISLLVSIQKRRCDWKQVKNQWQNETSPVPIYAAGDEMDRVKKRSYFQEENNHPPLALVLLVAFGTLAICSYVKYPQETKNFVHDVLTNETPAKGQNQQNSSLYQELIDKAESELQESQKNAQPLPIGSIHDMEMNSSLTFSNDYKQLFVTTVFVNHGNATLYNMVPTYKLLNKNNEVVQQKDGDMISALEPGKSVEKTTAFQLEIEASELSQCLQSLRIVR